MRRKILLRIKIGDRSNHIVSVRERVNDVALNVQKLTIINRPGGDGASESAILPVRHVPLFVPDICILEDVKLREMNNSTKNTQFVKYSLNNGNYRSKSSTFLYMPPFIAHNMRVRTAGSRAGWIRGDRAIDSTPSVCMNGRGGIT